MFVSNEAQWAIQMDGCFASRAPGPLHTSGWEREQNESQPLNLQRANPPIQYQTVLTDNLTDALTGAHTAPLWPHRGPLMVAALARADMLVS